MTRLRILLLALLLVFNAQAFAADPAKVMRYAFQISETSFDPVEISDLYSAYVVAAIFDAPLTYDYLARPFKLRPNLLEAMPEVSDDGKNYLLRFKRGVYFQDDPVFQGRKREMSAADYVYGLKRIFDPANKCPNLYLWDGYILGMDEVAKRAKDTGRFDYDAPVPGLELLDRYTLRIHLTKPNYNLLYYMTDERFSAQAREVVEHYGKEIGAHPVGTGPYRLAGWKRSSKIILEAYANFREEYWDAEPPADDPAAQEIYRRLKGKRLPMIGRIEIYIIEEPQTRWLAFLNEEHDFIERLPNEFINHAAPLGKLNTNLARRGMQMDRVAGIEINYSYFAMENPVVGGYTPEKVALRRAIALGYNVDEEIRIVRKSQAIAAESPIGPGAAGYDPDFHSSQSEYNPARARALLDMFGYVDRDGDGFRETPDGRPLVIEYASAPDQERRQLTELWKKNMDAIGIRMDFKFAKWPDLLKESKVGKLMMWGLGWSVTTPDADSFFVMLYGPNAGQANHSRFNRPEFNELYRKAKALPDSPERNALYRDMSRLFLAYMPWCLSVHRIYTNLSQPWVIGYKMNPVMNSVWKYVDIDLDVLKQRRR
jgi:ABC-type transport system substrate-binding protein